MTSSLNPVFHQLEAVLFDLDGTLLDTARDFALAVNRMRVSRGLAIIKIAQIRRQVSKGAAAIVETCLDISPDAADFHAEVEAFLSAYENALGEACVPFPEVENCLRSLEACGVPWGIVTNKPLRFAKPLLEEMQLDQASYWSRAATIVCPDHVRHKKPDPESLMLAVSTLQVNPNQVIYVGDDERDIQAGRAAQMKTCALASGYLDIGVDPAQWHADYLLPTFADLIPLIFH